MTFQVTRRELEHALWVGEPRLGESDRHLRPSQPLSIPVDEKGRVSALLRVPRTARACYVLAHGAGAGMSHPFMASIADGLAQRGIATLRYQFPYMEAGIKRPDSLKVAQADRKSTRLNSSHQI